jgi:hypothetical protein
MGDSVINRSRGFQTLFLLLISVFSISWSRSFLATFLSASTANPLVLARTPSQSPTPSLVLPQLLGILLVGRADIYTIKDWLHRHVKIFDKLVIVDGSYSNFVKDEVSKYNNTILLSEETLNLTNITDQTLRKPAMTVFGDPVGSWIMLCHADEFWTIDPRRFVYENIQRSERLNLLRMTVLTASPLESEYTKEVQKLDLNKEYLADGFHIIDVSNLAHNKNGTSDLARRNYFENRFFRWEEGMKWGDGNHLVIPQYNPRNYTREVFRTAFYVHFKLHDFSSSALNGSAFANSQLQTGLHNNSEEGWMGTFLDESFPDQLKRFPPQPIESALYDICTNGGDPRWPCELPWTVDASFK